jgi:hypothetical protein
MRKATTAPLRWLYLKIRRMMIMSRQRTSDRANTSTVLTVEQLGPRQSKTPEGFLLCEEVPIARVGLMLYGPKETPINVGRDGIARVTRDAAALFHDDTIASFNGKSVVNEHPPVDVRPDNWKTLTIGTVLNPRRGTNDDSDVILADLLITDASAIRDIEAGKREVSAGYEADYEQTGEGTGTQTNIIGNHVALVQRGRCGPRCAIGDHQSIKEPSTMGTTTTTVRNVTRSRKPIPEAIRKMFKDAAEMLEQDPAALDEPSASSDPDDSHTHIHIHANGGEGGAMSPEPEAEPAAPGDPMEARVQALETLVKGMAEQVQMLCDAAAGTAGETQEDPDTLPDDMQEPASEMPPPTKDGGKEMMVKDGKKMTADSAALERSYAALISDAEVLVPGFRVSTFDSRAVRKVTMDTMCAMRTRVLSHFHSTADGKAVIDNITGGEFDPATASCAAAAVVFRAAAGAKRMLNNASATRDSGSKLAVSITQPGAVGGITSIAALNAFHARHYAGKNAAK